MDRGELIQELAFIGTLAEELLERIGMVYPCQRQGQSCLTRLILRPAQAERPVATSEEVRSLCIRCRTFMTATSFVETLEHACQVETTGYDPMTTGQG